MRRRNLILASAVLAVTGLGLTDSMLSRARGADLPAAAAQPAAPSGGGIAQPSQPGQSGAAPAAPANTSDASAQGKSAGLPKDANGATDSRDATNEVRGVQSLFAQAADAAIMKGGGKALAGLFVNETSAGAAIPAGASGQAQGIGTNGAISSNGVARPTDAASHGSPTDRTAGTDRPGTSTPGSSTGGGSDNAGRDKSKLPGGAQASGADAADASKAVAKSDRAALVKQFNAAWNAKYHQDFHIADGAVVLNDLNANDIMMSRMAQPAGARLGGNGQNPASPQGNAAGDAGTTGAGATGPGARGNTSGTNGNAASGGTPRSQTGAGAVPIDRSGAQGINPSGGATGASGSGFTHAADNALAGGNAAAGAIGKAISQQVTVQVPAVRGAPEIKIHLMREGPSTFRFVTMGNVDHHRLVQSVDRHLQTVLADQKDWPADVNEAQRLVTQHVLMAISDYSSAGANADEAQPAGARLPGAGGSGNTAQPSVERSGAAGNGISR